MVERYVYDPYGAVTYLTASWGSQSGSNYAWHYLFQGGRLDVGSGLYDLQYRDYSPNLGRWVGMIRPALGPATTTCTALMPARTTQYVDPTGLQPTPKWLKQSVSGAATCEAAGHLAQALGTDPA